MYICMYVCGYMEAQKICCCCRGCFGNGCLTGRAAYFNCQKGIMQFVLWTSVCTSFAVVNTRENGRKQCGHFVYHTNACCRQPTCIGLRYLLRLREESIVFIAGGGSNQCWTKAWIFPHATLVYTFIISKMFCCWSAFTGLYVHKYNKKLESNKNLL